MKQIERVSLSSIEILRCAEKREKGKKNGRRELDVISFSTSDCRD
jgi:hypothetical protein